MAAEATLELKNKETEKLYLQEQLKNKKLVL
jgi:hypothetical protein